VPSPLPSGRGRALAARDVRAGAGVVAARNPVPLAASTCRLDKPEPESSDMRRLCRPPVNVW
jgi:hypothetical protein